jgi:hypothetical protein
MEIEVKLRVVSFENFSKHLLVDMKLSAECLLDLEITVSIVSFLRQDIFDGLVHFLSQSDHDVLTPLYLLPHHDYKLSRTFVDADCGLVANFTIIGSADVDDSNRDLGSADIGAASIFDQECEVSFVQFVSCLVSKEER